MKKTEIIGILVIPSIAALIALFAWLSPFHPVGSSPLARENTPSNATGLARDSRQQQAAPKPFDAATITESIPEPFRSHLLANPSILTAPQIAETVHIKEPRSLMVFAVGSAAVKDETSETEIKAREVCELKALSAIVAAKDGWLEIVKRLDDSNLSREITYIAKGHVMTLPIIGEWWSPDRTRLSILYGKLIDPTQ